ncbi:MAG TPA: type III secretion protein [Ruminococcaceae bacterium]|jgi:flagellar biosynthesis protein|nr:type III secretion protein [Oscillospiraceae bacterium]
MSRFEDLRKAAALKYSEDSPGTAPVVVASGMGYTAKRIVDIAVQNGVPVYKDDSLAGLLSQLNEGTEIPPELYKAVVDIYVYFLHYGSGGKNEKAPAAVPDGEKEENSS